MGGARRRSSVLCAMCVMVMAVAGCASASTTGVVTSTPGASTPTASATAGCAAQPVTLTLADNNKTLCVTTGTAIAVLLRGAPGSEWELIKSDSTVLAPHPGPGLTLPAGMTGAAFVAARPGQAVLSSIRLPCRTSLGTPSDTGKNKLHCGAIVRFHATVIVKQG